MLRWRYLLSRSCSRARNFASCGVARRFLSSARPDCPVPIVDCQAYPDNDDWLNPRFVDDVTGALVDHSTVYLRNAGFFDPALRQRMDDLRVPNGLPVLDSDQNYCGTARQALFEHGWRFFQLSEAQKSEVHGRLLNHTPPTVLPRGYIGCGEEQLNPDVPCFKSTFNWGCPTARPSLFPSEQVLPGFEREMRARVEHLRALNHRLLRTVALGLGLEATRFTDHMQRAFQNCRFLHYAPRELTDEDLAHANADGDIVRGGEHTDSFVNTLILSPNPGLRVRRTAHEDFVKVPVIDEGEAVLVIPSDTMQRWTKGMIRALKHQVVVDSSLRNTNEDGTMGRSVRPRLSFALFCHADPDAPIHPFAEFDHLPDPFEQDGEEPLIPLDDRNATQMEYTNKKISSVFDLKFVDSHKYIDAEQLTARS